MFVATRRRAGEVGRLRTIGQVYRIRSAVLTLRPEEHMSPFQLLIGGRSRDKNAKDPAGGAHRDKRRGAPPGSCDGRCGRLRQLSAGLVSRCASGMQSADPVWPKRVVLHWRLLLAVRLLLSDCEVGVKSARRAGHNLVARPLVRWTSGRGRV